MRDYEGDSEMVRSLKNGDQIRQTIIQFRKTNDYESYINAIDQGYESEDAFFIGLYI